MAVLPPIYSVIKRLLSACSFFMAKLDKINFNYDEIMANRPGNYGKIYGEICFNWITNRSNSLVKPAFANFPFRNPPVITQRKRSIYFTAPQGVVMTKLWRNLRRNRFQLENQQVELPIKPFSLISPFRNSSVITRRKRSTKYKYLPTTLPHLKESTAA